jgi:type II secretory pathway pseudopilin PulG
MLTKGGSEMKGQISTELMVIVALVLLIFIPLLVLVYFKANEANNQMASYQAELAVFRIAYLANSVGSLGTNTSITTDIQIPKNVKYFGTKSTGLGGEITMLVESQEGTTDISTPIKYPLANPGKLADQTGAGGWMKVRITSEYVSGQARLRIEKVNG